MTVPIFLVDAFSGAPFAGNAAAVCLLDAPADPSWMQAVADELQQAATAFVLPQDDLFSVRWFVSSRELMLCGHGTLAAAHVLWESGRLAQDSPSAFETVSGILTAWRDGDLIRLDFPAEPVVPAAQAPDLVEALGIEPRVVMRGSLDYLVELAAAADVRALTPDFARLRRVETRGIIVTARTDTTEYDFVSRFFAPGVGIDEDAVTGSAHCALGPYWSARLGRETLVGYQASARGGVVRVRVDGDRVELAGRAVTTVRGTFLVLPPGGSSAAV